MASDPPASPDDSHRPPPTLREAAVHVAQVLIEAGYEAYFAGGCVRDKLMGVDPTDYDVATDARPEEVSKLFRGAHSVGASFGVILIRHHRHTIEVATFRTDGVYSDGRHPDTVTFSDAEHDAQRRDFTINGMFEHPATGEVVDYVGGRADLEAGVIRAIGDPTARLNEDRLRMLRAIRFGARLGFDLEERTADAIRSEAGDLAGVSRERIGDEVKKMLNDPNRGVAAWEMQYLGLDGPVFDEPSLKVSPTRVGRLPDDIEYTTTLAAWLVDRYGPDNEDHDEIARRWGDCLMLSNAERTGMSECLDVFRVLRGDWWHLGVARQKRLAASRPFQAGLAVLQTTERDEFVEIRRRVWELSKTDLAPDPLIDGTDLIALGGEPGPRFRTILEAVYDAQLEGAVADHDQAVALARAILEG